MLTKNNIESLKEGITKDDLKRWAVKDEEVLIFDFLKDISDQIDQDFFKERFEGQTKEDWLNSKPDSYFKRLGLKSGGRVIDLSKYRKSNEPVRVKNIALTTALENAKTIKSLSSDDLNLVNRLLRISLEKEVEWIQNLYRCYYKMMQQSFLMILEKKKLKKVGQ